MNITLKNIEIVNLPKVLNKLLQCDLPVKTGWNIVRNIKSIEKAMDTFLKAERLLVEKYGKRSTIECLHSC